MRAMWIALLLAGCSGDVDEAWVLDHDRVIAVRATPPAIAEGETAVLDALVGRRGALPAELSPPSVTVVSPSALAGAVMQDGDGRWVVQAPDAATLGAARASAGIAAGASVPLVLGLAFPPSVFAPGDVASPLMATSTVWLGAHADNPLLDVRVDGRAVGADGVLAEVGVELPLAVAADEAHDLVQWLTSCGDVHDADLPEARLRVDDDGPCTGQLGVVRRREGGGVAWQLWPLDVTGAR